MNARYARVSPISPRYPISDMKNPHPIRSRYPIFRTMLISGDLSADISNIDCDLLQTKWANDFPISYRQQAKNEISADFSADSNSASKLLTAKSSICKTFWVTQRYSMTILWFKISVSDRSIVFNTKIIKISHHYQAYRTNITRLVSYLVSRIFITITIMICSGQILTLVKITTCPAASEASKSTHEPDVPTGPRRKPRDLS